MGRKKIQISRILDQRNRQVTFTKRKFGLMKKAYELSVLCDCEIALIIFNSTNRLFQYASTDMDKVLLKYTEYSEPHESRTNSDILETLKRKGLGLEGPELDLEEALDPAGKLRRPSEGVDLTLTRPKLCSAASLSSLEGASVGTPPSGSEGGAGSTDGSPLQQNRLQPFKATLSRHGVPPGRSPGPLPSGIGYPIFSPGNLSRALSSKTPPPLYLGADPRRAEGHLSGSRTNMTSATVSPALPAGTAPLPGHGLPGYPFLSSSQSEYTPGDSASHSFGLQASAVAGWQHRDMMITRHPPLGTAARIGICDPAALTSASPPVHVKSERLSPAASCSTTALQPSPCVRPSLSDVPMDLPPREDYVKAYHYSFLLSRSLAEEPQLAAVPPRRMQPAIEEWQR
ncbi:myocyte-specific enhancer factor 2B isoform X2 [Hemicordylus capensis]|uniref:myocyte-specific enhancer factor 2B isoform X2 n=1 Tax=Hemicordylus capensis TaxID=884348 RepID=UPI0023035B7B|nr:myocyte-specific enhancer factor 2B isoform X2 [Hemicordylus capensis]